MSSLKGEEMLSLRRSTMRRNVLSSTLGHTLKTFWRPSYIFDMAVVGVSGISTGSFTILLYLEPKRNTIIAVVAHTNNALPRSSDVCRACA